MIDILVHLELDGVDGGRQHPGHSASQTHALMLYEGSQPAGFGGLHAGLSKRGTPTCALSSDA